MTLTRENEPRTAPREPLDVRRALAGRRVFVTGATGFIGKVLVEKLLWSVPEIGELLLLIRPSADVDADRRLQDEILDSPIMSRLRALHAEDWESWAGGKLEVITGDLENERFGLEAAAYAALARRVDCVVASAATVTFDERLDRAVAINARGALQPLELARAAGHAPLVHLSTCFVSGRRAGLVPERITSTLRGDPPTDAALPAGALGEDLDEVLHALDEACAVAARNATPSREMIAEGGRRAARYGFHDVYTLTKALGERLLERAHGAVPLAIVRPAIVESALAEPIPGWIDAVRVADPLLVAYGRGLTREFAGSAASQLDIVPVDAVVNATLAALADLPSDGNTEARPTREAGQLVVYQVSSASNPISIGEMVSYAREGFARTPLRNAQGAPVAVPRARFVGAERYRRKLLAKKKAMRRLARRLPGAARRERVAASARTLDHALRVFDVYRPYLDHRAIYDDSATRALAERLSPESRATFPCDLSSLDWRAYLRDIHVPGLVRFALRADSGAPPPPPTDDPVAQRHAQGEWPAAAASHLFELLAIAGAADPAAVALQICREGRWLRYTYGQALTATSNLSGWLQRRHGIGPGDRVALWSPACPEWTLASFAIHRLGAVVVPLDPQWPPEEIAAAARFTGAKLLCAAPNLAGTLPAKLSSVSANAGSNGDGPAVEGPGCPVVDLLEIAPAPEVGRLPGAAIGTAAPEPDDVALILFTSGTTVEPKAVPLTHGNLLANVRDLVPVMRPSRDRLLSVLPAHHVFEFMVGLLVPLVGGGTISYVSELKPAEIQWMMSATRPTQMVAVPRLLELLYGGIQQSIASGGRPLRLLFRALFAASAVTGGRWGHRLFGKVHRRFGGELRRFATGGSALDPELGKAYRLMGFQVAEGYGMTETSPVLTVNPWEAIRFGSVGKPLPGVEIDLRPLADDPNGAESGPAGAGAIWVRGANVMRGYYRNPQATRQALRGGWLNTGDVGRFDRNGYLRVVGRTKEVIVTAAGKNVYPEEVERRYRELPEVAELVVVGLPAPGGGERVAAVVVPRPDSTSEVRDRIEAAIAERSREVPSYQRIGHLEIWPGELPKTTTLKVQRSRLRQALIDGGGDAPGKSSRAEPPLPPNGNGAGWDEDQSFILGTVARLTRTRPDVLQASDRLAELGVDSLTKAELLAAIEGRLGTRVDDETAAELDRVGDLIGLFQ